MSALSIVEELQRGVEVLTPRQIAYAESNGLDGGDQGILSAIAVAGFDTDEWETASESISGSILAAILEVEENSNGESLERLMSNLHRSILGTFCVAYAAGRTRENPEALDD